MVILCDEPMSAVYGKLTCRFDRSNSTLTVSEAYVLERWRHVSMFQDMLHAAVERCRAKRVIVEETSNEAQWSRLFRQVVAGARVQGCVRSSAEVAVALQARGSPAKLATMAKA